MKIITRKEAIEQGLKRYFTGKPCKHGHISERNVCGKCLVCHNERMKLSRYNSEEHQCNRRMRKEFLQWFMTEEKIKNRRIVNENFYRISNKEKVRLQGVKSTKAYRERHPARLRENRARIYYKNHETAKAKARAYARKESTKKTVNARNLVSRKHPDSKLRVFMSNSLRSLLNYTGESKRASSEATLGYGRGELVSRIESQFRSGMEWGNYGLYGWHIDHIKPIKAFIDEGVTDPKIINALDNLQPLWATDNLSKGAKYNEEEQCN